MTNADLFKEIFGKYLTEVWAMPESAFLEFATAENERPTITVETKKNEWLAKLAELQMSYSGCDERKKTDDYRHGVHDGIRIAYELIAYGIDGKGGLYAEDER